MIDNNPLEEGVDNQLKQSDYVLAELQALNEVRKVITNESTDYTNDYNSPLNEEEEIGYQSWKSSISNLDESIYDYKGLYKETFGSPISDESRLDPKYRKPSHMEFTRDSIYNGSDGNVGGAYTDDGRFIVGPSNSYSPEEVQDYFNLKYPTLQVEDKRQSLNQTESLRQKLRNEDYSYVLTDQDAYNKAQKLGDKTIGENIKDAFDPSKENLFGRIAGIGVGGYLGAALGGMIVGGPVGAVAMILLGSAGAMMGDAGAVAWSKRDEDEIEETLLRLESDDYTDSFERERAEQKVAAWYNETNIERFRGNTWGGTVADIFLESLPYMASFMVPGGALKASAKPLTKSISAKLSQAIRDPKSKDPNLIKKRPGLRKQLEGGDPLIDVNNPFKITKEQSKEILRRVRKVDVDFKGKSIAGMSKNQQYRRLMEQTYEANVTKFVKSTKARLGIGPATLLAQQPKIFNDLKIEQLESVYVEDGKFKFDKFTGADIARKEAQAALAILVETVGFPVAQKIFKKAGVYGLTKKGTDFVLNSKAFSALGGASASKAAKKFFETNTLGKSFAGKTQLMKDFKQVGQFGSIFEEASEEWIEMTASAILGLDSDERKDAGLSYAENLVDKVFFPILHPKEASAILTAVGIIPVGAGAISKLKGDTLKEEFSQQIDLIQNFLKFQDSNKFADEKEAFEAFEKTEEFTKSLLDFETNKKWYQKGIVGAVLKPGKQQNALVQAGLNIDNTVELNKIVQERAEEIARSEGIEVNDTIKKKAIQQIVSERLIVRLADNSKDAKLLNNLLKDGSLRPFRGASKQDLQLTREVRGDKEFTTEVFEIDSKIRKQLESDKKLGSTYKRIFSKLQLINFSSNKEAIKEINKRINNNEVKEINLDTIKQFSNAINEPNNFDRKKYKTSKEYIEAKRQDALKTLKDNLRLSITVGLEATGNFSAARIASVRKQIDAQSNELLDGLVKQVQFNPDLQILTTEAIRVEEAAAGRTLGGIYQAYNIGNKIILTPEISTQGDKAARVLEEESLEVNFKSNNQGKNKLNKTASANIKYIRNRIRLMRQKMLKGTTPEQAKKAKEVLEKVLLKYEDTDQGNFELFISLVQNRYGDQESRDKSIEDSLFELLDERGKAGFNVSVMQSFTGDVQSSLIEKMPEAEKVIASDIDQGISSKGKTAVEKFIDTKSDTPAKKLKRKSRKIQTAKQEAIEEVKAQLDILSNEDQRILAQAVLNILENEDYDDSSKIESKRKRAIKKIHTQFSEISYSFTPEENSPDYDEEIDGTETSSSDMDFDSTHGERFLKGKIQQQIISRSSRRDGTIKIMILKKEEWFIDAISSEEKWNSFLQGNHSTSLERLIQDIGKNTSLSEMKSFHRSNISNHIQMYFKVIKTKKGTPDKIIISNPAQPFEDIYNSTLDSFDNPEEKLDHYEKLLPIVSKEIENLTANDIKIILSVVEENTGIPSSTLNDINLERNNSIIRRIMLLDKSDLEISTGKTGKKNIKNKARLKDIILHGAKITEDKTLFGFPEKDNQPEGVLFSIMKTNISDFRITPMFTNVENVQKNALRGDSQFDEIVDSLFKQLNFSEQESENIKYRSVMFLDGMVNKRLSSSDMKSEDLLDVISTVFFDNKLLFGVNKNLKGKKVYYHHMGRFGEKGASPFVLMEYYGKQKSNLLKAATKVKKLLPKDPNAKRLFKDPVELLNSYKDSLTNQQILEIHYAINDIIVMNAMHGDISNYMLSEKKTKGMQEDQINATNFLNIIARQSQILTDGVRYRGSLNAIQIEDIPGITDANADAFDGQALITNSKMQDIANDLEIENTDTLKAHISNTSKGERTLVKVNWINLNLASESNPVLKQVNKYVAKWNKNNPDNKIEAIVFPSGAKYSTLKNTNWKKNEDPIIVNFSENDNLIISQDLHHSNNANHEGQVPSQRQAHLHGLNEQHAITLPNKQERIYTNNGSKALSLRSEASELRLNELGKEKIVIGPTASPLLQQAYEEGLDVESDPRFTQEILNIKLSTARKSAAHQGKRVATQTIGEGDLNLSTYEVVKDNSGNELVKLPRININIIGGRYETVSDFEGKPFNKKEEAIKFVKANAEIFADMFFPQKDGTPDINNVLDHEIELVNGKYIIPGEIVDRTRIPSGSYASHSFNRLKDPVTKIGGKFSKTNVAVPQDGIRIGMGEDLDGDKGFSLVLARKINKAVRNGMYGFKNGEFIIENPNGKFNLAFTFEPKSKGKSKEDTLQNQALLLEHIMWINPEILNFYNAEGDIPKNAFDKVINRESSPIYKELQFGTILGRKHANDINYVRAKVIGIIAVHNSLYSNTNAENIAGDTKVELGDDVTQKQIVKETFNPQRHYLFKGKYINAPSLNNSNRRETYRSTKSIFDIFLNQALDDHKDPRLFFAGIDEDTASMLASLLFTNIKNNDIPTNNNQVEFSKAAQDAQLLIEFLLSDEIKLYKLLLTERRRSSYFGVSKNPFALTKKFTEGIRKQTIQRLIKQNKLFENKDFNIDNYLDFMSSIFAFNKKSLMIVKRLNATHKSPSGSKNLSSLILNASNDNITLNNTLNDLSIKTVNVYSEIANEMPQTKLGNLINEYLLTTGLFEFIPSFYYMKRTNAPSILTTINLQDSLSELIILESLAKSLNEKTSEKYYKEQRRIVLDLIKNKTSNKLLKKLTVTGESKKVSLNNQTRSKELSQKEIEFLRQSFNLLNEKEKIALATVAYLDYGLKSSHWTGSYVMFFTEEISNTITNNSKSVVDSISTAEELFKALIDIENNKGIVFQDSMPSVLESYTIMQKQKAASKQKQKQKQQDAINEFDETKSALKKPKAKLKTQKESLQEKVTDQVEKAIKPTITPIKRSNSKENMDAALKEIASLESILKKNGAEITTDRGVRVSINEKGNLKVNIKVLSARFINNLTDNIYFDNVTQYAKYEIEKAKLKQSGVNKPGKAALKNINFTNKKINPDMSSSFISVDRIKPSVIEEANKLETEGKSSEEIYNETGLFKWTPDGKWRFELDDSKLTYKKNVFVPFNKGIKLNKFIGHPLLFKVYPELENVKVVFQEGEKEDALGAYMESTKLIVIFADKKFLQTSTDVFKETFLHELQHAIQDASGLPGGNNVRNARNETYAKIYNDIQIMTKHLLSNSDSVTAEDLELYTSYDGIDTIFSFNNVPEIISNALLEFPDKEFVDVYFKTYAAGVKYKKTGDTYFDFYRYITTEGEMESNISAARNLLSKKQKQNINPMDFASSFYKKYTKKQFPDNTLYHLRDNESISEYIKRVGEYPPSMFPDSDSELSASLMVQSDLINKNVLNFLENYGFEIQEADNLLIDLLNKNITLDKLNIEQVASALSESISYMMQRRYGIDLLNKNLNPNFQESKSFKTLLDKADGNKIEAVRLMFNGLLQRGFEDKLLQEYNEVRTIAEEAKRATTDISLGLKSLDMEVISPFIETIIDNTFKGDDYIRVSPASDRVQVDFQGAFDENNLAKEIMSTIGTNKDIFLTGSIVLATQGTVYRKQGKLVHDLDFVSNFDTPEEARNLLEENFDNVIEAYNWVPGGQEDHVLTFLVPPKGYKITNVKRFKEKGKIVGYKLVNEKTDKVAAVYNLKVKLNEKGKPRYTNEDIAFEGPVNLEPVSVDFFTSTKGEKISTNETQEVPFKDNQGNNIQVTITNYKQPMKAKMIMSRLKDIYDYNRFILFERLPKSKLDSSNIPYTVDKRLNISNIMRSNEHFADKQIIYADLANKLIESNIEIDKLRGSEIHYNTILETIKNNERDKLLSNGTLVKDVNLNDVAFNSMLNILKSIKDFKNIGKLPGNLQAKLFLSVSNNLIDNKILSLIDKQNYEKAVDLIIDIQNTNNDELINEILKFDSFKDTIEKISLNQSPNVLDQSRRTFTGYSEREIRQYLLDMKADKTLEDLNISNKNIFGTIQQQRKILKEVEASGNMELLGVIKKAIRLTNGVNTKYQLNNNTSDSTITPSEISNSFMIMDKTLDLVESTVANNYGVLSSEKIKSPKQLMQDALLFGVRQGKELTRYGIANKSNLLSLTGSAKYVTDDGKVYKRTAESDKQGRKLRQALTIFLESYKNNDGNINKSWAETKVINQELGKELIEYKKYSKEFDIAKKRGATSFTLDDVEYSTDKKLPAPIIPTLGEVFEEWEAWKTNKDSTGVHPNLLDLSPKNINKTFNKLNNIFKTQYDQLEKTSGYIGELWFAKRNNYVPHVYSKTKEELEEIKKMTYADKENSRSEQGRKYNTYADAYNEKGLLPKDLDLANLIEEYTTETAKVSRQRVAVSGMAQVSDEDMLPMMLVEGIEKMGILTEDAANAISNKLELAMYTINRNFKSNVPKNINGFERLSLLTKEINPAELGYQVVDVGYKSIKTAWVKKGIASQLMDHVFADQREFKHNFSRIAFESLLTLNHVAKTMSIGLSLFHPFALIESLIALDGINGLDKRAIAKDKNGNFIKNKDGSYKYNRFVKWNGNLLFHPFRTIKDIKREYRKTVNNPSYGSEWVQAGLQFDTGRSPDIEYGLINSKLDNAAANMVNGPMLFKGLGHGLKLFNRAKWAADRWLWEVMLPGMKMYSANNLYSVEAQRQIEKNGSVVNEQQLREDISAYVNDAFGGQEWEKYMWANQRVRKWLNLFMFAPDWTLSALNISGVTHLEVFNKAIGSPTSELHARNRLTKYWIAFPTIVLMGIPNILQASIWALAQSTGNGDDEDEVFTFQNEMGHKLHVDITPFWRTIGVWDKIGRTQQRRTYLAWGKQAYEVFGPKGWLRDPVDTALGKSSIAMKIVMEQGFDMVKPGWETPWAKHNFLESIFAVEGNMWDGRLAAVGKKFVPLSLQPILDGMMDPAKSKPTTFFAPVKLGMNSYTAQREIASVLRVYAEGGLMKEFKGLVNNAALEDVVAEIVDAAEKNGYKGDQILAQGISQARSFYYEKFFKALDNKDESKMNKAAAILQRLDTRKSQIEQSVKRKLEQSDRKLDRSAKRSINRAWFSKFRDAANK